MKAILPEKVFGKAAVSWPVTAVVLQADTRSTRVPHLAITWPMRHKYRHLLCHAFRDREDPVAATISTPLTERPPSCSDHGSLSMRIMSLNAWGGTLGDALLPYLRAEQPDVLYLQEIPHSPATTKAWLEYRDGSHILPQRTNLFTEIASAMPEHLGTFHPAARGVLWNGELQVPSMFSLATFIRRSLPCVAQLQGFVHKRFSPHGYSDHPRARNAHIVRLYDVDADRMVVVAQMHGLRDLRGKMDTPERLAQAHRLTEMVSAIAEPGDTLVVCGNFNVEPGRETFAVLGALGLTELVTARGFPGTRTASYTKPGRFADYLLVNRPEAVRSFAVVMDPEVSDHCPLLLEI
ncbi:MAG: endonuclease/exonuclease/phosphatase family protein [Thermomicrobiales bacterium]